MGSSRGDGVKWKKTVRLPDPTSRDQADGTAHLLTCSTVQERGRMTQDVATDAMDRESDADQGPAGPPWAPRRVDGLLASSDAGAGSAFADPEGG